MLGSTVMCLKNRWNVYLDYYVEAGEESIEKLYEEEQSCILGSWGDSRKRDFINGRLAGHRATFRLQGYSEPIVIGGTGMPIWKSSLLGSISHKERVAISAVTNNQSIGGLGVDIESLNQELTIKECRLFCNEAEIERIKEKHVSAILLFSVKEAMFKAFSEKKQDMVDFRNIDSLAFIEQKNRCYYWTVNVCDQTYLAVCAIFLN